MRTVEQLRSDFSLYLREIERCENAQCYWALLHILLVLPDICASLEDDPTSPRLVGDRYVEWCNAYLPTRPAVSGDDRYQMRNALLHAGSTTAQNLHRTHHTSYTHFSFVDPGTFDISVHGTATSSGAVLNIHVTAMEAETRDALEKWFEALQRDSVKMARVESNLTQLTRFQPKKLLVTQPTGAQVEVSGWTRSST